MKISIIEKDGQNLYACKDDKLIFYSHIKYNHFKRNVLKIFDGNNHQILELKLFRPFLNTRYKIISQDKTVTKDISKISDSEVCFEQIKLIQRKREHFFALNLNASYFSENRHIADVKQKMWYSSKKIQLLIEEKDSEFLKIIIIHILATCTEEYSG
jgi:hypothetical protein